MLRARLSRALAPLLALALAAGTASCASADRDLAAASADARPRPAPTADESAPTDTDTDTDDAPATGSATTDAPAADDAPTTTAASAGPGEGGSSPGLAWAPCDDADEIECASLDVPLDYDDPGAGTITLQLQRSPATDPANRIGSLLLNPGGPGVSTLDMNLVGLLPLVLDDPIVERFDLVGWDPRGVGRSDHVECVDDLDPYLAELDPTPDDAAEEEAYERTRAEFVAQCEANSGELLPHVSTPDAARDMDAIRAALGEDTISYMGFSYGSTLGATYATLFPGRVRAMVIDAAANPTADPATAAREQAVGIERALDTVLADCAADNACAFHNDGDPAGAFDELFARLDANPLPSADGRPAVGQAIMAVATISALYDSTLWSSLTDALAEAQAGDGEGLLELFDQYWQRSADGTWANSYEALIAINCIDASSAPDIDREALAAELARVAPRTGAWFVLDDPCATWPASAPAVEITGAGAGPILVLGNTGDPVTPIESTEAMARALEEGRLVTYEGTGHTAYLEAVLNGDECVIDAVNAYLVDLDVPPEDLVCGS